MMSNEEFDRKMDFIVNQQAQFTVDIQQLQEAQKVTEEKLSRAADSITRAFEGITESKELAIHTRETLDELANLTTEGFRVVAERFNLVAQESKNTDAKIAALVDSQIETEEQLRNTDAMLRNTDAMLRNTDALIRNIGVKFDRHLKEDHNSG